MTPGREARLLAHLGPGGPRGRRLRRLFAEAASDHLVLRRGSLVAVYGADEIRAITASGAVQMPTPRFPQAVRDAAPSFVDLFAGTLPFREPEAHARLRGILLSHFTPRNVASLDTQIAALAAELVDAAATGDTVDLVSAVADPLSTRVIATLIGAPRPLWEALDRAGHAMLARLTTTYLGEGAASATPIDERGFGQVCALLWEILSASTLPAHSVGASLQVAISVGDVTAHEALGLLVLLYMTGVDTVAAAVATAALNLLEHPDVAAEIARDPRYAGPFVDEVLRLDPPLPYSIRAVRSKAEVAGIRLSPGDRVVLCQASAGLDPRRFPDPLAFLPGERPPSFSFGHGLHRCLGAALARQQVAAVVLRLATRGVSAEFADIAWAPLPSIHTPIALPVRIGAAVGVVA